MGSTFARGHIRNDDVKHCPFCGSKSIGLVMTEEELKFLERESEDISEYNRDNANKGGCHE